MTDDTKNILITGVTDGVGRMVAERLATPGNNILVHGRDRLRGESVVRYIRSRGVTVNALHPATYLDTSMVRGDGVSPLSSVSEGAEAILNLAVSLRTKNQTGLYFDGLVPSHPHPQATDRRARARLKALSMRLTGLQEIGAEI